MLGVAQRIISEVAREQLAPRSQFEKDAAIRPHFEGPCSEHPWMALERKPSGAGAEQSLHVLGSYPTLTVLVGCQLT